MAILPGDKELDIDRLKKIAINFPDPGDNLRFHLSPPLILEKKLAEFEALVAGCRVIILDPLRYLVGGNFCKPVVATAFLSLLKTELIKLEATVIICHHIKKPNQALLMEPGDLYEMKGATALMTGKYKASGNMGLLLKMDRIFSRNPSLEEISNKGWVD